MRLRKMLLDADALLIAGLNFLSGGVAVPILEYEQAAGQPQLNTFPVFILSPGQVEGSRERAWTEGTWWVNIPIQVVLVRNSNLDLVTNLATTSDWEEQVAKALESPLVYQPSGITCIEDVEVREGPLFDFGLALKGYDVTGILLIYRALLDHGN